MLEKLKSLLTLDNLFNIIYFLIGIILGIIIIIFVFKILSKIANKQKYQQKDEIKPISNPEEVYLDIIDEYDEINKEQPFKIRITLVKKLLLKLITNISKCYYPNKKNSIYEIDLKTSMIFLKDIIKDTEELVNKILDSQSFKLIWGTSVNIINVKNKIKKLFNKDYEPTLNLPKNVRSITIGEIYELLENNKSDEKSDNKNNLKILNKFIDNEVHKLIKKVYEESVLIYSNKYLESEELNNVNNQSSL